MNWGVLIVKESLKIFDISFLKSNFYLIYDSYNREIEKAEYNLIFEDILRLLQRFLWVQWGFIKKLP